MWVYIWVPPIYGNCHFDEGHTGRSSRGLGRVYPPPFPGGGGGLGLLFWCRAALPLNELQCKFLKGVYLPVYIGGYIGGYFTIGAIKGDTWSLDYGLMWTHADRYQRCTPVCAGVCTNT